MKGGFKQVNPVDWEPPSCQNLPEPIKILTGEVIEAVVYDNGSMKLKIEGMAGLVPFGRYSHDLSSEQIRMMRDLCFAQQSG